MFVELHILQNFAPSNLNRDDTGAPKDCEFGGYRRARVSSQCLKRAIRTCFEKEKLLPESALARRTKGLAGELVRCLGTRGKAADEARAVVEAGLKGYGLALKEENKTEYPLFLGRSEIDALAGVCADYWDDLAKVAAEGAPSEEGATNAHRTAREAKKAAKQTMPDAVRKAVDAVLNGGRAADLALFGRMIADLPGKNVDAACQVAHAISTNKVSVEFDFFTAVDDLKPNDTAGAGMLGTVEFNSACFYRYANVDLAQLTLNLGGDEELARKTLDAFIRASIAAVPTGKQNSMAAQNPPSFVFAVARKAGLWSLANAFCDPVRPRERGLVQESVSALDGYWGKLAKMYGEQEIAGKWACSLDEAGLVALAPVRVDTVAELVAGVLSAATFAPEDGARR